MMILFALAAIATVVYALGIFLGGTSTRPAPGRSRTGDPPPLSRDRADAAPEPFIPSPTRPRLNGRASFSPAPRAVQRDPRHALDAGKTVRTFNFILRSLGFQPSNDCQRRQADYAHDLAVMLDHGDLSRASIEFVARDRSVIYRHCVRFNQSSHDTGGIDRARGVELPVLPRDQIADYRIIVAPASRRELYRAELRLKWGHAEGLTDRDGTRFESAHTARTNNDRLTGDVFVGNEARRTGRVINVSADGTYAFAHDAGFPTDVYLHRDSCRATFQFRPGQKLSFIVIQTPRGLQGRDIELG